VVAATERFMRALAASWDGRVFEDPDQKVKVAFLTTRPEDARLELVQPVADDSPVLRMLRDKGGGLHHVCYEVGDLAKQMAERRLRGSMIAKRPKPAVAFGGRRIAWMLTTEKLLVELLEKN